MTRQHGFSLLEIIIVVAIISIITAVAWPWYERYRVKVYRTECITALYIAANDLDRCGALNGNNYAGCTITSLAAGGGAFVSRNGRCIITPIIGRLGDAYGLTAAYNEDVNPEITAADALCGNLTLNNLNQRRNVGGAATVEYCWGQ